jgi:hypothetical protein
MSVKRIKANPNGRDLFMKLRGRNSLVRNYPTHLSHQQEGEEGDTTAQQLLLGPLLLLQELKYMGKHHNPRWNLPVNLLVARNSQPLEEFLSHRLLSSSNQLFSHNNPLSISILPLNQLLRLCHLAQDLCKPLYNNNLDLTNASLQHAYRFHRKPLSDLLAWSHESNGLWLPHSHCSRLEMRLL